MPGLGSPLGIISTYYKTRQGSPVGSRPFPMGLYPIYDTPLDIAVTLNQSRNILFSFHLSIMVSGPIYFEVVEPSQGSTKQLFVGICLNKSILLALL